MHVQVSLSVLLSCYIVIRDTVYLFYSCEIYRIKAGVNMNLSEFKEV